MHPRVTSVHKCVCVFALCLRISPLSVRCYVGTAVSRLRRPCLSLRLLLYRAISSRAEVAGSGVGTSASGLAAGPRRRRQQTNRRNNFSIKLPQFHNHSPTPAAEHLTDEKADESLKPAREAPHSDQQLETSRTQKFRADNWSTQWLHV